MPDQTIHASQFYKFNNPSSYPKIGTSKNFWLKNLRTSKDERINYVYLGDVDIMIKQLKAFFKSIPQYSDYDLILVGEHESVLADLNANDCVITTHVTSPFVHLTGATIQGYSKARQQQINQVNFDSKNPSHAHNQTPLGAHTLGLLKRGLEQRELGVCGYGNTFWKGLRVYFSCNDWPGLC